MNKIDRLLRSYQRYVSLPWPSGLPSQQRVWCAVYDPDDERRLRPRLGHFAAETENAGHKWCAEDLTHAFGDWLGRHRYRDQFFANPNTLKPALRLFRAEVVRRVRVLLLAQDANVVVALHGVAGLFGVMRVSELIDEIAPSVAGRLLVFFPGRHDTNIYRLLDARDGWNYHAVAIKADDMDER